MSGASFHACALEIGGVGVLLRGKAGSGKTSLMFGLHEQLRSHGVIVNLISDDYVMLKKDVTGLLASAPATIRGKAEVRGYGIIPIKSRSRSAIIGLVVDLVENDEVPRMPLDAQVVLCGCQVACLKVPVRHEQGAIRIILAWMRDNADIGLPLAGS